MANKEVKKVSKKQVVFILLNVIGLLIFFLGGAKLLAYIVIAVLSFIIGKFYERVITMIKDYRLLQKVNKLNYSQTEIERIREENKLLKKIVSSSETHKKPIKNKSFSLDDIEIP